MAENMSECAENSKIATVRQYSGLWDNGIEDDTTKPIDSVLSNMGNDSPGAISYAIEETIADAKKERMSASGIEESRKLLQSYRDIL